MASSRSFETEAFDGEDGKSDFECGSKPLDDFLRAYAGQNQKREVSRTWILRRPNNESELPRVLGYYTLTLGSLEKKVLPEELAKGLPPYPVPIAIIARLARHLRVRGQGYGERLLLDAQERALAISEQAGCLAVVVDAKDEAAAAFYKDFGYVPLLTAETGVQVWPRRMIQSLKRIRMAHSQFRVGSTPPQNISGEG